MTSILVTHPGASIALKRLLLFYFILFFGAALSHLTAKPEPYFEAEVLLNTQNLGLSFETFELTTDDDSTRGKFV